MKRGQVHGKVIKQVRLGLEMLRKYFTCFTYHLIEMESFWSEAGEHIVGCKTTEQEELGFWYVSVLMQ